MARPLAIETTRFDSIWMGCMLVVVVDEEDRNNVGFRLFRGGSFASRPPVMVHQISKLACFVRVHYTANHRLLNFVPPTSSHFLRADR